MFDEKTAQLAANSHMVAIEWKANTIKQNNTNCDFKSLDSFFLNDTDTKEILENEYAATKLADLLTHTHSAVPGITAEEGKYCIKYPQQA